MSTKPLALTPRPAFEIRDATMDHDGTFRCVIALDPLQWPANVIAELQRWEAERAQREAARLARLEPNPEALHDVVANPRKP